MDRMSASDFRKDASDAINRVAYGGERIIVQRRGKDAVAVVPITDYELLCELEDRFDIEEAGKARKDIAKHGTVPWEDVKRDAERGSYEISENVPKKS